MGLLVRLASLLALLGAGVGGRHAGVLRGDRRARLNAVAFYVALPALIFDSTYGKPLEEIVSPTLAVGPPVVLLVTAGLGWVLHRRVSPDARRRVAIVQSYHSNLGYLGVPIVAAGLGSTAAATASVILGIASLIQIPLTVWILASLNDDTAAMTRELRSVVANPVILALLGGLTFSALDLGVPSPVAAGLDLVSVTALPLALLLVGSALELDRPRSGYRPLGSVLATKVVVMPILAFAVFSALGATTLTRSVGIVMFGAPTAVSTFVYAGELGGDERFASLSVFASTVASLLVLFAFLQVY